MKKNVKYIIAGTVVVAAIAALIVAWIFITQTKVSNAVANIYQNGTLIRSIDLEAVEESYTFKIEGENGAYNTVLVEPGCISITDASCHKAESVMVYCPLPVCQTALSFRLKLRTLRTVHWTA